MNKPNPGTNRRVRRLAGAVTALFLALEIAGCSAVADAYRVDPLLMKPPEETSNWKRLWPLSFLTSMTHPERSFSHGMTQGAKRNSHGMTHP